MANQLKMAKINSILTLHQNGWSSRRIAKELCIHRDTVRRHIRLAREQDSKPAKAPPGLDDSEQAKPAKALTGLAGEVPLSRSDCEPFREIIEAKLAQGLTAQRIHQDLAGEHGFGGQYHSARRFVKKLRGATPLPFRRMECEPGQEAQVDFGTGAPVVTAGARRRTHVLRVVLSHSRKGYSESVFRQTTESFLRCLENAFWHFGGAPRTTVIDNLKAAVARADWYDPEVHPIIQSFCEHYGTVILPAKPYTPRHKGKVERGIGYVKGNALKGRKFATLADQNRHLLDWETHVADTRIHGTTRKQVGKVFREVERAALLPLPPMRFPMFHEAQRSVHRDGHVEVDKAYYSVPPEYAGRRVWVRWDGRLVRVFNRRRMEQIAVHAQQEPGRFSTQPKHIHSQKISGVERGTTWLLGRASLIGPQTERWARAMLADRGIQGVRVLVGLLSLAGRHNDDQIEQACEMALTHNAFRLRAIRELIKRGGNKQEEFEFLAAHEIIRDIADYGELVHNAFGNQTRDLPACDWADYTGNIQTNAFSPPPLGVREEKKHSIQETFA
jgi:transposase